MANPALGKPLNNTLGVKRSIKHFDFSEPYWEETRQKKLVIQYCKATGKYQHFPRPVSIFTGRRRDIEWREVSGKGTVYSFTIAHRGPPAFHGKEPYAVASVTLDVGVNLIADGSGVHIPKGYTYFAMGFSVFVEMLNLRFRAKAAAPVHLHTRYVEDKPSGSESAGYRPPT